MGKHKEKSRGLPKLLRNTRFDPKMIALGKLVNSGGMAIRPQMVAGARAGMEDQVKKMQQRGLPITVEGCMEGIKANTPFLVLCAKVDITEDTFRKIAEELVEEYAQKVVV